MITIKMPGFSADASLYSTSRNYAAAVTERGGAIHLAQFDDVTLPRQDDCARCRRRCRRMCQNSGLPSCSARCFSVLCSDLCAIS
jgi:hypothetical protein